MPTQTQFEELTANTTYEWTTIDGINGGKLTAQNGNYVFFPAAGDLYRGNQVNLGSQGTYWSSTPDGSSNVYYLQFFEGYWGVKSNPARKNGYSVRPVVG